MEDGNWALKSLALWLACLGISDEGGGDADTGAADGGRGTAEERIGTDAGAAGDANGSGRAGEEDDTNAGV